MKVCFALLYYDPRCAGDDPRAYLDVVPLLRHLPRALAARGHQVEVVALFPRDGLFEEAGVRYRLVAPGPAARAVSRLAGLAGREAALWLPAWRALRHLRAAEADLWHVQGTTLHLNLGLVLAGRRGGHPPFVLHHHGGEPPRSRLGRRWQRFVFARAGRLLFTSLEQVEPWVRTGVLADTNVPPEGGRRGVVEQVVETSSAFLAGDREDARRRTGMTGDPVCLSAGRLHPIKDPMTMLKGFEGILAERPEARLYCCYLTGELLGELEAYLGSRPGLAARVRFLGRLEHAAMEQVFSSADFLLQASRREHSGVAVLDAMACGVIPVLSDIPSFRTMTAGGRHGLLFPPGDPEALTRAVLAVPRSEIASRSAAVRAHFERHLSFEAMAEKLERIYRQVLSET